MFKWWRRRQTLSVTCPECGHLVLEASQVRLFVCKEDGQHQLSFPCSRGTYGRMYCYADDRSQLDKLRRLGVHAQEWSLSEGTPSDISAADPLYKPTPVDLNHPLSERHRQVFARQLRYAGWFDQLKSGQHGKF